LPVKSCSFVVLFCAECLQVVAGTVLESFKSLSYSDFLNVPTSCSVKYL
jgi:hypothetical protein